MSSLKFCKIIIAASLLLTATVRLSGQIPVKRNEVEISLAANYPMFTIAELKNGFLFEASVAYRNNLPDVPVALGGELVYGAVQRGWGGSGWPSLTAAFTAEYDWLRGRNVSPFAGLGVGIGLCSSSRDTEYDFPKIWAAIYPFAPVVSPRIGVEFWNGLRITLKCQITRKEYSSVSLGIGYAFGGGRIRNSD